jgi:DNA-binding transcriptional LysR family regulator
MLRMDLRQLTYFMAVADARHLGRAAEKLHLSQPPLTRQIQQLEAELGVHLFKRTPRGMSLTAAGEALARDARNIHSLVEQAAERAQRAGQGQVGRLDVGLYGSAIFGLVPQVLQAFRRSHPDVELVLHQAQTPQQLPALRQGRVQLVFERLLPEQDDIQVELVAREPMLLALAEGHALAAQELVDVADLREETLIVGTSPAITALSVQLCRAHGFVPRLSTPNSDIVTATVLAASGAGVTFVPGSMTHVQIPGIAYRPIRSLLPVHMDLHCFYLRDNDSPLLAALLHTVSEFRARADGGAAD